MSYGGRGLPASGILKMFQSIAATRRIFICIDALDKYVPEHRMVILESLGQILGNLRIPTYLSLKDNVCRVRWRRSWVEGQLSCLDRLRKRAC